MAAARLVAWGLLLAAGVPAAAGRPPPQGTPPAAGDPGSSWGHRQPGSATLGDMAGELSGAGDPDGERWRDASPPRWSRPPWPRGTGDSLQVTATAATPASAGTGAWRDGSPATVEEPFIAGRGREAEGRAGAWMGTWVPSAAPTDVAPGSPAPAHGLSLAGTAGPRPTVSTIAPRPMPGAAVGMADVLPGSSSGPSHSPLPGAAERAAPAESWTPGLAAHQRSTRRAPPGNATAGHAAAPPATPPPRAAPVPATGTATPGSPLAGTEPEEELGSPQRVRGALSPPNATEAALPAPQPAAGTPGPRRADTTGTRPPGPSTAAPSSTWRRGLIRVTTQRALPRPAVPEPSVTPTTPGPSPPCPPPGEPCSAPWGNGTGPRWAELRRALSFAWDAHVYGSAALFLLLSLGCLAGLLGAPALRPPHLPHILAAHGLLLAASVLRATFLLLDPYGTRGRLPPRAVLLLATAPFPLLLAAFAVLLQRLQRLAQLRLLPPRLRSLPALGAAAAVQSGALGAADLLSPWLSPAAGLALHALGCAVGALLLLAGLHGCWRVLRAPGGSEALGLRRGARALAAAAALGLPCCGLQLYSALWLWGALGPPGRFCWPCWAAQLWLRADELAAALALLAAAAEPLCRRRGAGAAGHSCWAKALRYFCAARKAAAPEYPNNCYDWAGAGPERAPASDISKSLIRNAAEQLPLRALKDSNEARAAAAPAPGLSPKCPNAAAAARSYASLCLERGSALSLGDLAFRPPSPIDLRRSIDQALCRQHLLRDGLFGRPRRGSGASLPAGTQPGGLARCSSLTELPAPRAPPAAASASSLESSSLHISWNPWRHGLSSPESPPPDEAPSRAPLLARPAPAAPQPPDSEREARRSFLALSKQVDSRSLSSDTIEL